MANPQNLFWTGTTEFTDGLPYTEQDHGGYEVEINGLPSFAIPVAWAVDNSYSFPILQIPNLAQGTNAVRLRTVAKNGNASEWTTPVSFDYLSVPQMPTNVSVV